MAVKKIGSLSVLASVYCAIILAGCGDGGQAGGKDPGDSSEDSSDGSNDTETGSEAGTGSETGTGADDSDSDCVPGTLGCDCDGDSCSEGHCVDDLCIDCQVGDDGCVCLSNDTCNVGLRCVESVCEPCPPGEQGCACKEDDTCETDLVCIDDVCSTSQCQIGTTGCPCRPEDEDPRCDGDDYCSVNNTCAECAIDIDGCPCEEGACAEGFECTEEDVCYEILNCTILRERGECGQYQVCNDTEDGPDCLVGECLPGFHWRAADSDCVMERECTRGLVNSIYDECLEQNRVCVIQDGTADDECGGCLEGYVEEEDDCVKRIACGADGECADDQYCDRFHSDGLGGCTSKCKDWPCSNLSQVQDSTGQCVSCNGSCDIEGSTGRFWPFHNAEGRCVCETRPDYFDVSGGGQVPEHCDADHDGWVRDSLGNAKYSEEYGCDNIDSETLQTMAQNARCDIRKIDRVVLKDEYGMGITVWSCESGLIVQEDDPLCDIHAMSLLETVKTDKPDNAQLLNDDSMIYGGDGGRHLRADELNALTKGCTTLNGDFNDNERSDIQEYQDTRSDTSTLIGAKRLESFSHFIELYTSYYLDPGENVEFGSYVIEERSRCDSEMFVLGYDSGTSYTRDLGSTYWRNCDRRRDPLFDADNNTTGFDFAQYGCGGGRTGSCSAAPPAHAETDATDWGEADPLMRGHGLCELDSSWPKDQLFRGMNHHSQFKCVRTIQIDEAADANHKKHADEFGSDKGYIFNECVAKECGDSAGCEYARVQAKHTHENKDPIIECSALSGQPDVGSIGWAAVNYQPYSHQVSRDTDGDGVPSLELDMTTSLYYRGGCINEDAEWSYLCPFPEYGAEEIPPTDSFGRFHCYCWEGIFLWAPETIHGDCAAACGGAANCVDCDGDAGVDCAENSCDWSADTNFNDRSSLWWAEDSDAGVGPRDSVWAPISPDTTNCD